MTKLTKILSEVEWLAAHPPGGDSTIGNCYQAVVTMSDRDERLQTLIHEVSRERKLTPEYFANLLFRAIQHIELNELRNTNYHRDLKSVKHWENELERILGSHGKILKDILLTRDTTTTVWQRYAGVKAILTTLFPKKGLVAADFGCGGNYGLPGIAGDESFKTIKDRTPGEMVNTAISKPVNVKLGWAIDKDDPNIPMNALWRKACQFYPSELDQLPDVLSFEERISKINTVSFVQADLLMWSNGHKQDRIPPKSCDAVIVSTVLYQVPWEQHAIAVAAKKLLKPNGIIIVQDYAKKRPGDSGTLKFVGNWSRPYSYRTFIYGRMTKWHYWEVLRFLNGRCLEVKGGLDFNKFRRGVKKCLI